MISISLGWHAGLMATGASIGQLQILARPTGSRASGATIGQSLATNYGVANKNMRTILISS